MRQEALPCEEEGGEQKQRLVSMIGDAVVSLGIRGEKEIEKRYDEEE